MGKAIDLTGMTFNHLTVIGKDEVKSKERRKSFWFCKCDCGNPKILSVYANHLKTGKTASCGHLKVQDLRGQRFGYLEPIHIDWDRTFQGNGAYWMCKCHLCNKEELKSIPAASLKNGHSTSCGCRVFSKGENRVEEILKNLKIDFIEQKILDDCRGKNNAPLKFDFLVFWNKKEIVIEYQGIQHYKIIEGWGGEKGLQERKERDSKKKEYCNQHQIPFIEIPYWDYDKLSEDYILKKLNA